jgi:hypothetical protein
MHINDKKISIFFYAYATFWPIKSIALSNTLTSVQLMQTATKQLARDLLIKA